MSNRNARSIRTVILALAGQIAVVVVLSNAIPSAAMWIFLFYGFWVPAWFFWDRIIFHAPGASETGKPLILVPAFFPIWASVIVLVWLPTQTLSQEMVWGIEILVILISTGLLLWHSFAFPAIHPRKSWISLRKAVGWIGVGAILGTVIFGIESIGVKDFMFPAPTVKTYSSLYFLPSQEFSSWGSIRSVIEQDDPLQIWIGIANHEGMASDYVVVVTQGEERAIAEINPISLEDGAIWEGVIQLDLQSGSNQPIHIFLERVGYPWPYRQLTIQW